LYVKHFEPIYPKKVRSQKSFAILKAFVSSREEIVTHQMLTHALKGVVAASSIGGYLKNFIDTGTIVKVADGQYRLQSAGWMSDRGQPARARHPEGRYTQSIAAHTVRYT
jgi:hypothetical protein